MFELKKGVGAFLKMSNCTCPNINYDLRDPQIIKSTLPFNSKCQFKRFLYMNTWIFFSEPCHYTYSKIEKC